LKNALTLRGVVAAEIVALPACRDTHDEALNVRKLCDSPRLATCVARHFAWHMRRASATFRTAGVDVVLAPCNFTTDPPFRRIFSISTHRGTRVLKKWPLDAREGRLARISPPRAGSMPQSSDALSACRYQHDQSYRRAVEENAIRSDGMIDIVLSSDLLDAGKTGSYERVLLRGDFTVGNS